MRFIEWYLGIPTTEPGQGLDWEFRAASPFDAALPLWAGVLLGAVVVVAVVAIYFRDARRLSWPRRAGLILLRLTSLALLLLMLGQFSLAVTQTGLPSLAILIDTSASMGFEDRFTEREPAQVADRLARQASTEPASRLNLAKALLTGEEGRFLAELRRTHRLHVYQFSGTAAPLDLTRDRETDDGADPLVAAIRTLGADGEATRPAVAVRQVLDDLRGSPPSAMLVLTDGIATTGDEDRLVRAADEARARSVPLVPIGFGSDEPVKDVQLTGLLAEDVVFADDPLTFALQVKAFGYAGRRAKLTLRREGRRSVIDTTEVELEADGSPAVAELTDVPSEEGDFKYVVEATALPGETDHENNALEHRVRVRREQLKVLLAERVPRWEFRHLKPLLERDPAVQLHTVLQAADLSFPDEDRTALRRFPVTRESLFSYDVVIIGDIDLDYLSAGAVEHLREFVAERGGGLILIAGPRFNPTAYAETPLGELLPVESSPSNGAGRNGAERRGGELGSTVPGGATTSGFRPRLTVEGRTRAALRLSGSAEENTRLWETLPPLYWLHKAGRRKPGAQVLAEHPTRRNGFGPLPVIVTQRFGAGQVLFHATDELWRWRERVEDRYYGRYWLQMVRYLSRSKLRGGAGGMELVTDRSVVPQGESVELRLRVLDPASRPAEGVLPEVVVEGPRGRRETVTLSPQPESPLIFSGRISSLPAGRYHAWLATPARGEAPATDGASDGSSAPVGEGVPSVDFRVEVPAGELRVRAFQAAELVSAARKSHGTYYPFWEAERFLSEVPPGQTVAVSSEISVPLWNRWELLMLLAALLAAEWISRKRAGLV